MKNMQEQLFLHTDESDHNLYAPIPIDLIKEDEFRTISDSSKILYALLLGRTYVSSKNHLCDEKNRVYVYFTLDEVMKTFGVGPTKAKAMFRELVSIDGKNIGLIVKERIGNKPSRIYVLNSKEVLNLLRNSKK